MNKKLGLFLIVSFLAVQALSLVHMADYGLETHEHHGQVCDIYLHSEHAKYIDTPALAALMAPEYPLFGIYVYAQLLATVQQSGLAQPRAPPLFS